MSYFCSLVFSFHYIVLILYNYISKRGEQFYKNELIIDIQDFHYFDIRNFRKKRKNFRSQFSPMGWNPGLVESFDTHFNLDYEFKHDSFHKGNETVHGSGSRLSQK